jgi:pimeloyl-ACP methyl ester carboxylesterase
MRPADEPLTRKQLSAADYSLSYLLGGTVSAPLVVLIHPAFGDHRCFMPQLAALAPAYRLVLIDLPGHGVAQRPDDQTRISATATLFRALLAQEGYTVAHLVGVSLGALVAQDIAARHPDAVRSLTVVGGYPIGGTPSAVQRAQVGALLKLAPLLVYSLDRFRQAVAREATYTPQARELFYRSTQGFTRRSLRAFAGNDALMRPTFQPAAVPIQIIVGAHERPLLRSVAADWQRREPGSSIALIPHAGHCANMDHPSAFNAHVLAFLRRHADSNHTAQLPARDTIQPECI